MSFGFSKGLWNSPNDQFYKTLSLKTLLIKKFWEENNWDDDNLPSTYEKHS